MRARVFSGDSRGAVEDIVSYTRWDWRTLLGWRAALCWAVPGRNDGSWIRSRESRGAQV